jgi:predicted nucleotidyltransferase component of viral defense system/predicted transcriptional regulator of viral defense system
MSPVAARLSPEGINRENRALLERLHRETEGAFGVDCAADVLDQEHTRKLLAYLARRGWLTRVRRGLYATVPLDTRRPGEWIEDPWVVAVRTFDPCYIGGWTACQHWGLTEQLFRTILVVTARRVRRRDQEIQGTRYRLTVQGEEKLFGTVLVWRERVRVADVVLEYLTGEHRDDTLLVNYADRLGNRAVLKRLGFVVEHLGVTALDLVKASLARRSAGIVALDLVGRYEGHDRPSLGRACQRDPRHPGRRLVNTRADIVERVGEWGLTEEVVEKDYVLGWMLWGIGTDPDLSNKWVFKGGTCLKKCYIETYRFSEDLDFTVLPGGPFRPEEVEPLLLRTLQRVATESGIDFSSPPALRLRPNKTSTEGRVYYTGPRRTPQPARVKLDISADERVVRPPVLERIAHAYPDAFPSGATIRCYSFDELFAEKIRAMAQRGRLRDLYDIIKLFRLNDLWMYPREIRSALEEKCTAKAVAVPTASDFTDSPLLAELRSEWGNMLGHQLPALRPLDPFLEELSLFFAWLEGEVEEVAANVIGCRSDEDETWSLPPTVATWRVGVPLETVRFAAANHLLVELDYDGSRRLVEPYSLRRTRAGNLILHAERADGSGHRSYRVERIEGLRTTPPPFRPRFPIEFSAQGPLHALPQYRTLVLLARRASSASRWTHEYLYAGTRCGHEFAHTKRNAALRPYNDVHGYPCRGRHGRYVGQR